MAPDFTLTDQFGKRVSLQLAPRQGRRPHLQRPGVHDDLPAHDDRPAAGEEAARAGRLRRSSCSGSAPTPRRRRSSGCAAYSQAHGMMHKWRFLTGSLPELKRVWRAYGIEAAVVNGTIDHTPATYVIDPNGRESRLYLTAMAYSSVTQLGYELAQSISALLPGHPRLHGTVSLAEPVLAGPREPGDAAARRRRTAFASAPARDRTSSSSSTPGRPRSPTLAQAARGAQPLRRPRPGNGPAAARRDRRGRRRARRRRRCRASCTALPHRSRIPVAVDQSGTRRRRLPRAGLALARARLGQGHASSSTRISR